MRPKYWFTHWLASYMSRLTIALAGNPNAGKSTIFNALTGLRQHTGNWPGKTVEKKTGICSFESTEIEIVDLPGTYSLTAFSPDEIVARNFITGQRPDAVICVVDATNLERNLYLVVQILELGVPVIVALNMFDQAQALGIDIDRATLSRLLGGAPVVPTTASRGKGIEELIATTVAYVGHEPAEPMCNHCRCGDRCAFQVQYIKEIEAALTQISSASSNQQIPLNGYCGRWLALKLLEGEADIVAETAALPSGQPVTQLAQRQADQLETLFGDEVDIITADCRYGTVSGISRQVTRRSDLGRRTLTDTIDNVVTHRLVGLPIFLLVMYLMFRLVIDVSAPFLDWIDGLIGGPVTTMLAAALAFIGAPAWLESLFLDGIVAGVGGILTFVPGLAVLFFFLALLEDSGYLARAAFVMDRFMRFVGLHGKSVIPLMLGFGCAVPAIYATRTIANRRDRLLTALLIPFMSCSARLPVYVVFAMAFFASQASTIIWLMYVLGIVVAILVGFVLSRTVLRTSENVAFVLELPPYRLPTLRGLVLHTWENTREFIQKAGTVILAISVVLWFLLNLPWGVENQRHSLFGRFSMTLAPALEPAGFGTWESSGALVTGFIAKELVVSSLAQIYSGVAPEETVPATIGQQLGQTVTGFGAAVIKAAKTLISLVPGVNLLPQEAPTEDTALSRALQDHYSPLAAAAFLVFVLLYVPCVATVGAIKQEFGGPWALSAAVYQTLVAWLAAVLVFQGGLLLGLA
jgi:ferrous iron transport protein B